MKLDIEVTKRIIRFHLGLRFPELTEVELEDRNSHIAPMIRAFETPEVSGAPSAAELEVPVRRSLTLRVLEAIQTLYPDAAAAGSSNAHAATATEGQGCASFQRRGRGRFGWDPARRQIVRQPQQKSQRIPHSRSRNTSVPVQPEA